MASVDDEVRLAQLESERKNVKGQSRNMSLTKEERAKLRMRVLKLNAMIYRLKQVLKEK